MTGDSEARPPLARPSTAFERRPGNVFEIPGGFPLGTGSERPSIIESVEVTGPVVTTVEPDSEPYDPCFGDPSAGWYGAHGSWEPCPVCNPPAPTTPVKTSGS